MLKTEDLLDKYSPKDVLEYLQKISKLKIGEEWKMPGMPTKLMAIIGALGIPIM